MTTHPIESLVLAEREPLQSSEQSFHEDQPKKPQYPIDQLPEDLQWRESPSLIELFSSYLGPASRMGACARMDEIESYFEVASNS